MRRRCTGSHCSASDDEGRRSTPVNSDSERASGPPGSDGWRVETASSDMARDRRARAPHHVGPRRLGAVRRPARRQLGRHRGDEHVPVHAGGVGASGHGRGRRARRLRPRDHVEPVELDERGLRPRRRAHAQLRRQRHRHPQLGLQVPWGGPPEPDAVRGGVPRGVDHRARPELPVDARRSSTPRTRSSPTTRRAAQASLDRAGRRRAHHPVPRRGRARRGELRGARDRPARRRRAASLRRRRGLLPDERAEPRRRGGVRPRRNAVPHRRRHEVLRPARDQGRARVPACPREPRRRGGVEADRQHPQAWGGRHVGPQGRGLRGRAPRSCSATRSHEAAAAGRDRVVRSAGSGTCSR